MNNLKAANNVKTALNLPLIQHVVSNYRQDKNGRLYQ
jgi:hypothetical protein